MIGVTSVIAVAAIIDGTQRLHGQPHQVLRLALAVHHPHPGRIHRLDALPHRIMMRKYLDIGDAKYLRETVAGLDIATAFPADRYRQQPPDTIRYGDEQVESLILRGTQPDYAAAMALFRWPPGGSFRPSTRNTRAA